MSDVPQQPAPRPPRPGPALAPGEERTWALLAHLSVLPSWLFGLPFLGPLLLYLSYRDRSHFVREHAAEALNMTVSVLLATLVLGFSVLVLGFVTFGAGFLLLWVVALLPVAALVCAVLAAVAASQGRPYRYPLIVRFVR